MEAPATRRQRLTRTLACCAAVPRALTLAAVALACAGLLTAVALGQGQMRTLRLGPALCKTTGGGKFVAIRGFPGERIDRRLLRDVRWMVREYKIFITDGYSMDPVHSLRGEHPLGLALDIVPDKASGGSWRKVARLARWAEPKQNEPRAPFRWVGWNGDANHGRGHHLHLSWSHSHSKPGKPARVVYTRRCPENAGPSEGGGSETPPDDGSTGDGSTDGGTGDGGTDGDGGTTGGSGDQTGTDGGGVSPGGRKIRRSTETGGVSAP